MKASQLLGMRHPLCLTAGVPFGEGRDGPAPFLAQGQASPPAPESPFPSFSSWQPISKSCPNTGSCEKWYPVETLDCRKGFLGGEGAAACSRRCTKAPLQESSLHRGAEMQMLWLRVACQPPLGVQRSHRSHHAKQNIFVLPGADVAAVS